MYLDFPGVELEKIPGHLFKGNLVEEGTTRRGTDTLVHRPETRRFQTQFDKLPVTP